MKKNIWEIRDLMGLKKTDSPYHVGGFYYEGVISTGDFRAIDDYRAGILTIRIGQHNYGKCMVSISTIDDGVWQGFSDESLTPEQIESIVKDFIKKWNTRLPSEEEFNKFLNTYKIHGIYTG